VGLFFGNCESGSGALLGARDGSVFPLGAAGFLDLRRGAGVMGFVRNGGCVGCLTGAGWFRLSLVLGDWGWVGWRGSLLQGSGAFYVCVCVE
jgi:hypothetical protein